MAPDGANRERQWCLLQGYSFPGFNNWLMSQRMVCGCSLESVSHTPASVL